MSNKKELNIQISEDLEPTYSNMVQIAHSDDEFSLRFIQRVHGTGMAKAKSIVSISPKHAKRLCNALEENIKKYENKFGEIDLPEEGETEDIDYVG
ncbi:hypothetical protein AKJ37_05415 [candidate division MSBL1 archaeon SCGC-AAA259I09]|uniref:DUF3467 domain-containing protein n=1 Tax=candidate division MSBL1 archaeon SCGC-AAA259I09 TaxID=1698267 RepID=A0A133UQA0_9EURY|nr:hypothetical protein AKJ37_05415 [candidate division MSBL1 archaeon SCGC-AAA259I09]